MCALPGTSRIGGGLGAGVDGGRSVTGYFLGSGGGGAGFGRGWVGFGRTCVLLPLLPGELAGRPTGRMFGSFMASIVGTPATTMCRNHSPP